MIRLIVHTMTTRTDRGGNTYSCGRFIDTLTGHSFVAHLGGPSNGRVLARRVLGDHEQYESIESTVTQRELDHASKGAVFEHDAEQRLRGILTPCPIKAAKMALHDLEQLHSYHYPDCEGGCPAEEAMQALRAVIE